MTLIGMGFLGEHEHRVDTQGRISIPARFREAFKSGFVLAKSPDKCIEIYTPGEWKSRAEEVMRGSINQIKNRRMRRINFSGAYQIEPDRQGRFQLPQPLRDYADIKEDVILAGSGTYIELWSKESWVEELLAMDSEAFMLSETTETREY